MMKQVPMQRIRKIKIGDEGKSAITMPDELKSWMTNPFTKVVLGTSEIVVSHNHLGKT